MRIEALQTWVEVVRLAEGRASVPEAGGTDRGQWVQTSVVLEEARERDQEEAGTGQEEGGPVNLEEDMILFGDQEDQHAGAEAGAGELRVGADQQNAEELRRQPLVAEVALEAAVREGRA